MRICMHQPTRQITHSLLCSLCGSCHAARAACAACAACVDCVACVACVACACGLCGPCGLLALPQFQWGAHVAGLELLRMSQSKHYSCKCRRVSSGTPSVSTPANVAEQAAAPRMRSEHRLGHRLPGWATRIMHRVCRVRQDQQAQCVCILAHWLPSLAVPQIHPPVPALMSHGFRAGAVHWDFFANHHCRA